ncbi:MAG: MBL fold metallo-hydrolase, partial [Deltaproteobacteria bacterium]|nr:MBL fold metallo-hydrolase [Deltaproteobacteria bacterium]
DEKHFGPVWFIPGENHGKYPYCHSIYIEGAGVLIDPASDRKRLVQLRQNPGVKSVWLSHWHEDHFMHLDLFDDLPLCISEPDAPPLSDLELFMDSYGIDDISRDYWRSLFKEQFHFQPRKPMRFLQGGEIIHFDTVTVEAISTPGHTPGHLSFFFKGPEVLFMGDYDLTSFGPWYGDVGSSIEETIASVKRLRNITARVRVTSHETGVFEEEPGKIWDQYLDVINKREEKLINLLDEPHTLEDIVGAWIVYGKEASGKTYESRRGCHGNGKIL